MIWIYVRIYTEECYLKWIKINVYNLYLCHLDFRICVFVHWISARVFPVTERIESNLIPVITFVPRELFLHYAPVCEMRTKAQKCFLSQIFISTVDILCRKIQLKNEPSDLLCLLWTIPALSCGWEPHWQWLFSHCFLYHSHGHILSEMWITNTETLRAKLKMGWGIYCIIFFFMTTDVFQRPFLLQIHWNPHLWHQFWECFKRACGELAFPSHLAELGNWFCFANTTAKSSFLVQAVCDSWALIKQRTWEVRLHTLSEHVVLSVHSDVWLSQSCVRNGHTGEIQGSLSRPDLH